MLQYFSKNQQSNTHQWNLIGGRLLQSDLILLYNFLQVLVKFCFFSLLFLMFILTTLNTQLYVRNFNRPPLNLLNRFQVKSQGKYNIFFDLLATMEEIGG